MTTNEITVSGSAAPLTVSRVSSGDVIAPVIVNAYGALSVPAYYRGINLLAETIASFPRSVAKDGAKVSADEKPHPLTPLLKRAPNSYVGNAAVFWKALAYNLAHRGNALARVERAPVTGAPVALHIVPFDDVAIGIFAPEGSTSLEKWYLIRPTSQVVPSTDMIHLQGLSHDGLQGIDPVALHQATLQQAATLTRYQTRYLQKGTMLKGTITFPKEMTDDQLDTMAASIKQHFTGVDADRDVMLIPNGGEFANATTSPQQSQIVEQIVASTKAIAQIINVPPDLLFERSDSKYSGVEAAGQWLERYTFRPIVIQIEAELTAKLLSPADQDAGYTVHLNMDALVRGDTVAQTTAVMARVAGGVETPQEARNELGLAPTSDPEADTLKRSGDTSPAKKLPDPGAGS